MEILNIFMQLVLVYCNLEVKVCKGMSINFMWAPVAAINVSHSQCSADLSTQTFWFYKIIVIGARALVTYKKDS